MDRIVVTDVQKTFQLKPGQVDRRRRPDHRPRRRSSPASTSRSASGEFITLVGPSGSGKSVLLDIIGGLTEASGGEAFIDTTRVTRPDPKIAYVFQQYALVPVADGARERRVRARGPRRRAPPSAGARRGTSSASSGSAASRTAIPRSSRAACSSAWRSPARCRPTREVLLMDEPFAALDAQTRNILQAELLRIWETINTTVVFVTHSIDEAIFLADRVVVMTARPGRVKEIVEIDLPRPRDEDVRASEAFNAYRGHVWRALRDEVQKAQKDWALAAAYAN